MKGLLIKDLRILKLQIQLMLVIVAFTVFGVLSKISPNFIVGYIVILSITISVGTISYDKFNNGESFLFAMPFDRKDYVKGKYILSTICLLCSILYSIIFSVLHAFVSGKGLSDMGGLLIPSLIFIPVGLLSMTLMLPIQIACDPEKGKYVRLLLFGGIFASLYAAMAFFGISEDSLADRLNAISSIPLPVLIAGLFAVMAVLCIISYFVSLKIIEKKQF